MLEFYRTDKNEIGFTYILVYALIPNVIQKGTCNFVD
jgi:hypothetical protein